MDELTTLSVDINHVVFTVLVPTKCAGNQSGTDKERLGSTTLASNRSNVGKVAPTPPPPDKLVYHDMVSALGDRFDISKAAISLEMGQTRGLRLLSEIVRPLPSTSALS